MLLRMTNAAIQRKLVRLEAEIKLIKLAKKKSIDFSIDEEIWQKMKPMLKRVSRSGRNSNFATVFPAHFDADPIMSVPLFGRYNPR